VPGMGPAPKPDGQRRRQNPTIAMVQLPNEGYTGPVPEWPLDGATKAELARWNWLWRKPQAAMWIRDGIEDLVARYVRNCITIECGGASVALAYLTSEVRQQEDRLGRSPMALLRLRWEVAPNQMAEVKVEETRRRPRLKAVDPSAVNE
jgi:hypothetical protein